MKDSMPPHAFVNAMNTINPEFDFRQWRKSTEWKIFVAGFNEAVRVANARIKSQYNMGETSERLFGVNS